MRISYFDFLRGLAIILVVFIHCMGNCYTYPDVDFFVVVARNMMNVAVPLFFAISGYFLASKEMRNGGYAKFLKKQIPRVYIPVVFCSLVCFFMDSTKVVSIPALVKIASCSYGVYYFIAVIIQCYLFLWFLQNKLSKSLLAMLFVIGLFWWVAYVYYISLYLGKSLPLIVYAGNFIPWGFSFALGMFLAKNNSLVSISKIIWGIVFFGVVSFVESLFIMEQSSSLSGLGQKGSAFCLNVFLCLLAFHDKSQKFMDAFKETRIYLFFCSLGRYSFGIYLIHLFVLPFVEKVGSPFSGSLVKWIVDSLLLLLICYMLLAICKRLFPKISRILLGV